MKKWIIIEIVAVFIILIFILRGSEDDWIRDSRGVYVEHGKPAEIPSYVLEQKDAINCAFNLYDGEKANNVTFNSQCFGSCGNYSVDIVHVPRIAEDNLAENQCLDFMEKKTSHFIELDNNGNVVRIN